MPIDIKRKSYFLTSELIEEVGITKATFYYWLNTGKIPDPKRKEKRRGWRLWTKDEIAKIKTLKDEMEEIIIDK